MTEYQKKLRQKMHEYAKGVYRVTKIFPKDELFGLTSQVRRAAMSVTLNYIEGFSRMKSGQTRQFYENAYASLKEARYVIYFAQTEHIISEEEFNVLDEKADEIGKMLWSEMQKLTKR